ncbi:MAG: DUF1700 domain-containing protein [Coriobacteriaceae bacterium]|jgi:uncharacterized membrane protein|nr:DUF1700 domain-containing protein [Coriobacteriaceae bacterium]
MDRTAYLIELERELKGLVEADRGNALAYYSEYLADALSAGNADASAALGSPRALAAQIKADIAMAPAPQAPAYAQPMEKSDFKVVWTVILAILAIPVGLPVAAALLAVIVAVLVSLVAVLVSFAGIAVSFFASGAFAGVAGLFLLFTDFAVGVFYVGVGLIALGISILLVIAFWQLGSLCVRGVARLFNTIRLKLAARERTAS